MKRQIDIEVPFKFCRKCERYKLKEESYNVDDYSLKDVEFNEYSCDYFGICKNAIKLYRESFEYTKKATPEESKDRIFSYLENIQDEFEESKENDRE